MSDAGQSVEGGDAVQSVYSIDVFLRIQAEDRLKDLPVLSADRKVEVRRNYQILIARSGNHVIRSTSKKTNDKKLGQLITEKYCELVQSLGERPSWCENVDVWRSHLLMMKSVGNPAQLLVVYKKIKKTFDKQFNMLWYMSDRALTKNARVAAVEQVFRDEEISKLRKEHQKEQNEQIPGTHFTEFCEPSPDQLKEPEFWHVWLVLGPSGEYLPDLCGYLPPEVKPKFLDIHFANQIEKIKTENASCQEP